MVLVVSIERGVCGVLGVPCWFCGVGESIGGGELTVVGDAIVLWFVGLGRFIVWVV